jgi:hypothetical protein
MLWDIESEPFHVGLRLDPKGCGAGWARIAIATRTFDPPQAAAAASQALAANPQAWRAWYEAFTAELREAAA